MQVNFDSIWWPKPSKLCCPIRHTPGVQCGPAWTSCMADRAPTERQARSFGKFDTWGRAEVQRMWTQFRHRATLPLRTAPWRRQTYPKRQLDIPFRGDRVWNGLLCEPLCRQDQGGNPLDGGRPQRCCELRH
eukprot:scaffold99734_cov84-Phaeocystis_antarctica.AAC.4